VIIDKDYLMFAAGSINEVDPDYAMEVMKKKFIS